MCQACRLNCTNVSPVSLFVVISRSSLCFSHSSQCIPLNYMCRLGPRATPNTICLIAPDRKLVFFVFLQLSHFTWNEYDYQQDTNFMCVLHAASKSNLDQKRIFKKCFFVQQRRRAVKVAAGARMVVRRGAPSSPSPTSRVMAWMNVHHFASASYKAALKPNERRSSGKKKYIKEKNKEEK